MGILILPRSLVISMHVKVWEQADRAFTTSSAQPNAKARVALGLDGPSNPPGETEQLGLGNEVFRRSLSDSQNALEFENYGFKKCPAL